MVTKGTVVRVRDVGSYRRQMVCSALAESSYCTSSMDNPVLWAIRPLKPVALTVRNTPGSAVKSGSFICS